jgi:hypothetical protein
MAHLIDSVERQGVGHASWAMMSAMCELRAAAAARPFAMDLAPGA